MILKNKNIVTGKQSYIFVVVCSNSTTTLLVKLWFCRKERLIVLHDYKIIRLLLWMFGF